MYWLASHSLRRPVFTIIALLLVTAYFAIGTLHLRSEFGYRPLLGGDHPSIQTLERFVETYGGGFPLLIVWECRPDSPCKLALDAPSIRMARQLGDELAQVEGIRRLHSPANSSILTTQAGGFSVRQLFENGHVVDDAPLLAERALGDPLWLRHLVSEDGRVGSIIVQLSDAKSETMVRVVSAVQEALLPFEEQGFQYHLVGHPIESVVAGIDLAESTDRMTPVTAVLIALVLLGMTRSWQLVVAAMSTMGVALVWTLGFLSWMDWPQDSLLQVLAPLILIVGVCDAVHLLSRAAAELGDRGGTQPRAESILAAAREVAAPCLMTTLTTGGAFLSFLSSDLETFVRFGATAAFGIAACLVLTFSLLPLLLMVLTPKAAALRATNDAWDSALRGVVRVASRRSGAIIATVAILLLGFGIGWVGYLEVDTDPNQMWGEQSRVTRWILFVDEHLRGLDSLEIDIALPENAPIEARETQQNLSKFVDFLHSTEGLGKATSVQDLIRRLNRVLHDDDDTFDRLGDSAAANAEILELIAIDDPDMLSSWLNLDRTHTRISVEGPSDSAQGRGAVLTRVRAFVQAELPEDWDVTLTGPFALEFDWQTQIQQTQLRSFALAFVLVWILVAGFLRSPTLAFAAMVPAALPVVVISGLMGYARLNLDVGRVMLAAIVIGIAIDDSIHLLDHYQMKRRQGTEAGEAIRSSVLHVGRAVVMTSVALSLGFLSLLLSAWQTISSFGFFVSVAVTGAMIASLLVLPAIIFRFASNRSQSDCSG